MRRRRASISLSRLRLPPKNTHAKREKGKKNPRQRLLAGHLASDSTDPHTLFSTLFYNDDVVCPRGESR